MAPHSPATLSEQTLNRICGEYLEMPGLRLTIKQAQRLWGLDELTCRQSLEFLTQAGFLALRDRETYVRMTDGTAALSSLRMAKASLDRRFIAPVARAR